MFDLSNLDFVTLDHLQRDMRYRVAQAFVDLGGARHEAGEEFVYRSAHVNLTAKRLTLRVEKGGAGMGAAGASGAGAAGAGAAEAGAAGAGASGVEKFEWVLDMGSETGPRPGNLKHFFDDLSDIGVPMAEPMRVVEAEVEAARVEAPVQKPVPVRRPAPLGAVVPVKVEPVAEAGVYEPVFEAAMRGEFEEGGALLAELDRKFSGEDHHPEKLGSWLLKATFRAGRTNHAAGRWLAGKAMAQWRSWAAGATSGGEGTARSREVEAIRRELAGYLG